MSKRYRLIGFSRPTYMYKRQYEGDSQVRDALIILSTKLVAVFGNVVIVYIARGKFGTIVRLALANNDEIDYRATGIGCLSGLCKNKRW